MSAFDLYVPTPTLFCSACGRALDGWQGKGGPCCFLRWTQNRAAPETQNEHGRFEEQYSYVPTHLRLPEDFHIYTCCECGLWVDAECSLVGGVWRAVRLLDASPTSG